jgi:hypothetical protein
MTVPPYVTAGTTIDSVWGNQVADSLVNVFASSAARSSAITSPAAGMTTYLATNTTAEGLYQYNSAGQWRKDWSAPWGLVGVAANGTSTQTIGTSYTDVTDLTITFSQITNRKYQLNLMVYLDNQFAGGNDITFAITTGANATVIQFGSQKLETSGYFVYSASYTLTTTATASTTWKARAISVSGDARIRFNQANAQFSIIDVGPAGAPA